MVKWSDILSPMFAQAFIPLKKRDSKNTLKRINPLLVNTEYEEEQTTIMAVDIPFYHGYRLLSVTDHTVFPAKTHYAIDCEDESYIITYSNDLIYKLNKKLPILLDEETALDYVRFFFSYVIGPYGKITPIENVDDISWKDTPPPNAKKAIAAMIDPLQIQEIGADGSFTVKGYFVFKTDLMTMQVKISKDGLIDISNEEILIEEMPILDDVTGQ